MTSMWWINLLLNLILQARTGNMVGISPVTPSPHTHTNINISPNPLRPTHNWLWNKVSSWGNNYISLCEQCMTFWTTPNPQDCTIPRWVHKHLISPPTQTYVFQKCNLNIGHIPQKWASRELMVITYWFSISLIHLLDWIHTFSKEFLYTQIIWRDEDGVWDLRSRTGHWMVCSHHPWFLVKRLTAFHSKIRKFE